MVSAHLYFGLGTRVVRVMMSLTFTLYETREEQPAGGSGFMGHIPDCMPG